MRKPKPTGQKRPTKIQAIHDSIEIEKSYIANNVNIIHRLPEEITQHAIRGSINWVLIKDYLPLRHRVILLWDGKRIYEGWRVDKEGKGKYPFILSITKEKVYNIVAWAVVEPPCL